MSNFFSSFPVTLALSAHWHTCPERVKWSVEHQFALEYSPNPKAFYALPEHLSPLVDTDTPLRHHGFFPGYEIGHTDSTLAAQALELHLEALDAMRGYGEQIITLHIGLKPELPLDTEHVVRNLATIVQYGKQYGITVALENLRRGPTSHPDILRKWASQTDAMITLDVGHATSNEYVLRGELTALDFVDAVADRLIEVHMYEKESDRHYAPQDMSVLGPIVDRLLQTECTWWTIELNDYQDALFTRQLLQEYVM